MNILKLWKTLLRNWEVKTLVFEPRFAHLWYTRRTHRGKAFVYSYLDLFIIYFCCVLFVDVDRQVFFSLFFADSQWSFYDRLSKLTLTFKRAKNGWWFISSKIFIHIWKKQINFVWLFWKYISILETFWVIQMIFLRQTELILTFKRAKNSWLPWQNL